MKVFLVSNLLNYKKINGENIPTEINNENGIVDSLKESLPIRDSIVFIASDPNNYEKVDKYSNVTFKSFELSGIAFDNYYTLDNRNADKAKELIENSNMIFLSGGDTLTQNEFFKSIKLKELLKDYKGTILGVSAGAINLANIAYDSPETILDIDKPHIFEGLGKTEINVEPHFILNTTNFNEDELAQRNEILKESKNRDIYALIDGSHITIENNNSTLHGEGYLIKDETITQLSTIGNFRIINENTEKNILKR